MSAAERSPLDPNSDAHLELLAALGSVPRALEIARAKRIFINRNLPMADIDLVGFDMDYTLALYNQRNLEELSIQCTLTKMIEKRGYGEELRTLTYDPTFALRGLVVDRQHGNVFKMDRFGYVGRVYHGKKLLAKEERHRLYRTQRIRVSLPRYALIDTLFALPEAVLYATIIDHLEKAGPVQYNTLWQDIRDCIDEAHRDETMKRVIKANPANYIERDPELAATLHKLRSSGKRLFLLTNSAWDYTDVVMNHLLDGMLPSYTSWRQYFDIAIVSAQKPTFFTEQAPFVELDADGKARPGPVTALLRNRIYQGGSIAAFDPLAGCSGDRVLYIGDHIYGDMLRAKKSSVWRTAMVLQELEDELLCAERYRKERERIDQLERQVARLDPEIDFQQLLLRSLQKGELPTSAVDLTHGDGHESDEKSALTKRRARQRLDELRAAIGAAQTELERLERLVDHAFNPYWGAIFREGAENSRFGEQVENYACVYTSRVSNFLAYSPLRFFRAPRDHMPHEVVT